MTMITAKTNPQVIRLPHPEDCPDEVLTASSLTWVRQLPRPISCPLRSAKVMVLPDPSGGRCERGDDHGALLRCLSIIGTDNGGDEFAARQPGNVLG